MDEHRLSRSTHDLPTWASFPINRCNLPAKILGSLTFQRAPVPLEIDGIDPFHRSLFTELNNITDQSERQKHFCDYMSAHFLLHHLDDAGLSTKATSRQRPRLDYRRVLLGWHFDSNSAQAAVWKGWAESRFGLRTLYHGEDLIDEDGAAYHHFVYKRCGALYGSNALEAQLDLVYAYAQYELALTHTSPTPMLTLYRAFTPSKHTCLASNGNRATLVLNNLNSFSVSPERSGEFPAPIWRCRVPVTKIVCFSGLLAGLWSGEEEYAVLGGIVEATKIGP